MPGAGDPQLTTPGVGRADVWVFDAADLGSTLGGTPLAIVTLFGDTPRALAVSPDGSTVYAAVFKSGNQTTARQRGRGVQRLRRRGAVPAPCRASTMPGGLPPPSTDSIGEPAPETGLIVKYDTASRQVARRARPRLERGRPLRPARRGRVRHRRRHAGADRRPSRSVGTTLFNMAVNPVSGALYVSNTEARNEVRFEGPGIFGGSTVQGHLAESRITVLDGGERRCRAT